MPELPEVEIISRDLDKQLRSKKIKSVTILNKSSINLNPDTFRKKVSGKKILSITRRAKTIMINLEGSFLLIHLKMTGQLVYKSARKILAGGHPITGIGKDLPNKFTRIIFIFDDLSALYFNDVRKFGWIKFLDKEGLADVQKDLGVEPLTKEFTLEKFKEILSHQQKTTIKQAIMNQKFLTGVGNIYADESLFEARIKPMRKVKDLKGQEVKKLWLAIPKILKFAIKHRGTSFNDYVDARGEAGNFINFLKVYGRAGEKCKGCKGIIGKTRLGGRGTHWCDKCQF